jgi:hypothetical protein
MSFDQLPSSSAPGTNLGEHTPIERLLCSEEPTFWDYSVQHRSTEVVHAEPPRPLTAPMLHSSKRLEESASSSKTAGRLVPPDRWVPPSLHSALHSPPGSPRHAAVVTHLGGSNKDLHRTVPRKYMLETSSSEAAIAHRQMRQTRDSRLTIGEIRNLINHMEMSQGKVAIAARGGGRAKVKAPGKEGSVWWKALAHVQPELMRTHSTSSL